MFSAWSLVFVGLGLGLAAGRSLTLPRQQNVAWMREQAPKPCCMPKQLEGTLSEVEGFTEPEKKTSGLILALVTMSYDATGKRLALDEHATLGDKPIHVKVILDYNEKRMYTIQDSGCVYQELEGDFKEACVPDNATFGGSYKIGYGDESVSADAWSMKGETEGVSFTEYVSMTSKQCILINGMVISSTEKDKALLTMELIDVSLGIKDPSVFKPPAGCKPGSTERVALNHPASKYFLNKIR